MEVNGILPNFTEKKGVLLSISIICFSLGFNFQESQLANNFLPNFAAEFAVFPPKHHPTNGCYHSHSTDQISRSVF